MRATTALLLAGFSFTLASCSKSPPTEAPPAPPPTKQAGPGPAKPARELILGKWQRPDKTLTINPDGTIEYGSDFPFKSLPKTKYVFSEGDKTLTWEAKDSSIGGRQNQFKWAITVTPEALTIKVLDSRSRENEDESWLEDSNDKARKGTEETFKRAS